MCSCERWEADHLNRPHCFGLVAPTRHEAARLELDLEQRADSLEVALVAEHSHDRPSMQPQEEPSQPSRSIRRCDCFVVVCWRQLDGKYAFVEGCVWAFVCDEG